MYKGLKPELEEIVNQLNIGDGIIIEHPTKYIVDRTIGYVYSIKKGSLNLTRGRKPRFILEKLANWFDSLVEYKYYSFENIKVIDPVNKSFNFY